MKITMKGHHLHSSAGERRVVPGLVLREDLPSFGCFCPSWFLGPPLKPGDESLVLVASGPLRGKSCLDPHLGLTRVPYCAFQHHGEIAPPGMNTVQDFLDQVYRASSLEGVDARLVSLWLISMSKVMWILWNTRLYRRL